MADMEALGAGLVILLFLLTSAAAQRVPPGTKSGTYPLVILYPSFLIFYACFSELNGMSGFRSQEKLMMHVYVFFLPVFMLW